MADGGNSSCVVTKTRDVECWGAPAGTWLGADVVPGTSDIEAWCPTSHAVTRLGDATQVVAGANHICVLSGAGNVQCAGHPERRGGGQGAAKALVKVTLPPVRTLRAARDATCAITRTDEAYCWGSFLYPARGEVRRTHLTPKRLPLTEVVAISSLVDSAVIDDGQRVVSWAMR